MENKKYIVESPIQGDPKKKVLFRIPPIKWEQLDRSLQERIIGAGSPVITNDEMDEVLEG